MLRLRASPVVLALLFACARHPDPEPLSSYGAERLIVLRGTDIRGTPIVYAYLFPRSDDGNDCPPLAPVRARIDGRTLLSTTGGDRGPTCFGAAFSAPLVVLQDGVDFHELSIADDGAEVRARIADLATDARLVMKPAGDRAFFTFDHAVRGRVSEGRAMWSATVPGDISVEGDTIVATAPREIATSGRVVLALDLVVDLEVESCEGIAGCKAQWLVHEVFDVSVSR